LGIRHEEGKVLIVDYDCDVEGCDGTLYSDGSSMIFTDPPKYNNTCTSCGKIYALETKYPTATFVRKEESDK
jgi:hypothetical protein